MRFKHFAFVVVLMPVLTSCGFFNHNYTVSTSSSEKAVPTSVTINYGDEESSIQTVYTNDYAKINEKLKVGYGCTGFFDQEEGGVKYFDGSGTSINVWQDDFPTVFYAQWKPLESFGFSYQSDEIVTFGYHDSFGKKLNEQLKTGEYKNALKANSDKKIKFTFSFYGSDSAKGKQWVVYFKTTNKYSEGNNTASETAKSYQGIIINPTDSFSYFQNTGYFTCRDANASGMYALVSRGLDIGEGKIADYSYNIEFIS